MFHQRFRRRPSAAEVTYDVRIRVLCAACEIRWAHSLELTVNWASIRPAFGIRDQIPFIYAERGRGGGLYARTPPWWYRALAPGFEAKEPPLKTPKSGIITRNDASF